MKMRILTLALLLLAFPLSAKGIDKVHKENLDRTWRTVTLCRDGMEKTVRYLQGGAFQSKDLLTSDQREDLEDTWKGFLDYVGTLDFWGTEFLTRAHYGKGTVADQDYKEMAYAAFLTQYRYSLEFLKELEKIPGADTLLNEPVPGWGLKKGSLAVFKFRFLNVAQAAKFMAFQVTGKWEGPTQDAKWAKMILGDEKALWAMGVGQGTAMTFQNGQALLAKGIFNSWFPTQKGVSEWLGDTKVWRVHKNSHLISGEQFLQKVKELEPGDIVFSRHEWYLSNIGLPGFWSHAALFVGWNFIDSSGDYFDDPEVKAWVKTQGGKKGFRDLLRDKLHHATWPLGPCVLEAVSEGVVFTYADNFFDADSLSVIRPRLSKLEKARAIYRAVSNAGKPYDFNFDFQSDDTLVCSELVYKAYEPAKGFTGMKFPLQKMAGRVVSSPNGMVEQFDKQYGTKDQQADLVLFLDGHEKAGVAFEEGVPEFRKSWKRPKWNVFLQ